jgi:hypothetical protein
MERGFWHSIPWPLWGKMVSNGEKKFLKMRLNGDCRQVWWNLAYDSKMYI